MNNQYSSTTRCIIVCIALGLLALGVLALAYSGFGYLSKEISITLVVIPSALLLIYFAGKIWSSKQSMPTRSNRRSSLPSKQASPLLSNQSDFLQKIRALNPENGCLYFYKNGLTAFLGNFFLCDPILDFMNETFRCSEAGFQWAKSYYAAKEKGMLEQFLNDSEMRAYFQADGEQAYQISRSAKARSYGLPSGWEVGENPLRNQVMWQVLQSKFKLNPKLKEALAATTGKYLLEHNSAKRDAYWSDNQDGSGLNMLGRMLMAIRDGGDMPDPRDQEALVLVRQYAAQARDFGIH